MKCLASHPAGHSSLLSTPPAFLQGISQPAGGSIVVGGGVGGGGGVVVGSGVVVSGGVPGGVVVGAVVGGHAAFLKHVKYLSLG